MKHLQWIILALLLSLIVACSQSAGGKSLDPDASSSNAQVSSSSRKTVSSGSLSSSGESSSGAFSSSSVPSSSGAVSSSTEDPGLSLGVYQSQFAWIDSGSVTRSDGVQIAISGLYVLKTEVSQALYLKVMGTNPSYFDSDTLYPVEQVNFVDAASFCNRLSKSLGFDTLYTNIQVDAKANFTKTGVRLPTEAEWEFFARAGSHENYFWGSSLQVSVVDLYTESLAMLTPWKVGSHTPNAFGIFGIHGNVTEWVNDYFAPVVTASGQRDPEGPASGASRVYRDGSFEESMLKRSFQISERRAALATDNAKTRGFRVVVQVKP